MNFCPPSLHIYSCSCTQIPFCHSALFLIIAKTICTFICTWQRIELLLWPQSFYTTETDPNPITQKKIMIAHLEGTLICIEHDYCILSIMGIGYRIHIHQKMLLSFSLQQKISLWIEEIVHEGQINLFGFTQRSDQQWFKWLRDIQGVGGRVALNILSLFSSNDLAYAIKQDSAGLIQKADGVGPKLSKRLVAELKDKAEIWLAEYGAVNPQLSQNNACNEAFFALSTLGYKKNEAEKALEYKPKEMDQDQFQAMDTQQRLRLALRYLAHQSL